VYVIRYNLIAYAYTGSMQQPENFSKKNGYKECNVIKPWIHLVWPKQNH